MTLLVHDSVKEASILSSQQLQNKPQYARTKAQDV
jgi:hypothetical protein